jgi:hypothetical protein
MNELTVVERAAVALQSDVAGKELATLVEQSKSITTVTNKDGRTECHAAAMRADEEAERARREQAIRDEEHRLAEQAKAAQEAAELAAFPEVTAQPAPVSSSGGLDETVVAVAPATPVARLIDRLDELVRQMTDVELSDLCVHAAHILAERKVAA